MFAASPRRIRSELFFIASLRMTLGFVTCVLQPALFFVLFQAFCFVHANQTVNSQMCLFQAPPNVCGSKSSSPCAARAYSNSWGRNSSNNSNFGIHEINFQSIIYQFLFVDDSDFGLGAANEKNASACGGIKPKGATPNAVQNSGKMTFGNGCNLYHCHT